MASRPLPSLQKESTMKPTLAIIGTGMAGMSAAYFLKEKFEVSLFEKNDYIGGHTHTIDVQENAREVSLDTGFMVFNFETYPLMTKLFKTLNVPIKKTDMSFSVQNKVNGLEFCGSGLSGLFGQRRNLLKMDYWKFLLEIKRFNEQAPELVKDGKCFDMSVADYQKKYQHSDFFIENFLIPMSSAVWSTPFEKMMNFPIQTLVQFFKNHGFLGLDTQHQWYTVVGGSRSYRDILISSFKNKIAISRGARKVSKTSDGKVKITDSQNETHIFDKVIIAAHGDEALEMLESPTHQQEKLLSPFKYQENATIVHSDESLMPKKRNLWSSWNYRLNKVEDEYQTATIYWMNSLQGVSDKRNYFISINDYGDIDPSKVHRKLSYTHPLFDTKALKAQQDLSQINKEGPIYFTGSYFRYGFHEDALWSSVKLCEQILNREDLV